MLKSLPIGDWPKPDREAWDAACRPAIRLRRGGSASHLAARTREDLQKRYGYFLTFLKESRRFDAAASCESLLTPGNVDALVHRMRNEWSPTTLFMTIQKLKQIARHLAPSANVKWLSDIAGDLRAEGGPVKQRPVVDASELVIAGLALVEEYSGHESTMDLETALNTRNGLMVALLASCPIRAKNFTDLTLGLSLRYSKSCWWIDLQGSETKSGRPDMRMLPEFLIPALEHYLFEARPFLLSHSNPQAVRRITTRETILADNSDVPDAAPEGEAAPLAAVNGSSLPGGITEPAKLSGPLWISRYGSRMTQSSLSKAVASVTEATIGVAIFPHGFRSAAATTAAWKAGNKPHLASGILQHRDRRITDASYNRTTSFDAARQLGNMLRGIGCTDSDSLFCEPRAYSL
jgi:integrase